MLQMSRKCVPYTPATTPLAQMAIAIVSSSGAYVEGQEPFTDNGDSSFRVIPGDTPIDQLRFKHGHYDTSMAQQDPNCMFPLGLLGELASEGVIRAVSNKHIGCKGFATDLKTQYEVMAPGVASEIERSQADGVLLTGG